MTSSSWSLNYLDPKRVLKENSTGPTFNFNFEMVIPATNIVFSVECVIPSQMGIKSSLKQF